MLSYDLYPRVTAIIELVSVGETLTAACDQHGVSVASFEHCIENDETLQALMKDAVRRGNDALAEALIHIENHKLHGHTDPKMAKIKSDNIKWLLERRDRRFAPKSEVLHEHRLDKTIIAALEAAKNRVALPAPAPMIDVTPQGVADFDAQMQEILS